MDIEWRKHIFTGFLNGTRLEEIITKDRTSAKIKIIHANFKKAVGIGKKIGGGQVVFTFF